MSFITTYVHFVGKGQKLSIRRSIRLRILMNAKVIIKLENKGKFKKFNKIKIKSLFLNKIISIKRKLFFVSNNFVNTKIERLTI